MNIRSKVAGLALAAALALTPAIAQHATWQGHGQYGDRMLQQATTVLSLTDAQKTAAQQIMTEAKAQADPIVAQLKQNRHDMQAAIKANNTANISQLAAKQGQLAGQLAEIHAKAMANFYAQLTPEQKAKADQLHHNRQNG